VNLAWANAQRVVTAIALALVAALAALALTGATPASAAGCSSFRVLHNDRIGAASFPVGNYEIVVEPGLGCQAASQLFARFLADYDGVLPKPWRLKNQTATFYKPAHPLRSAFRIEPINGA
jgi:hypothetical protein